MPGMERSRDWLAQARRDLEKARLDLQSAFYEWACFTAHQSAEKALKAVFLTRGAAVRGPSLLRLLEELQADEALLHLARVLDRYYIEARYPNGFPSGSPMEYFDETLAKEAIDAAESILRFSSDHLG
jgi:HEPN domain-containing protein